MNGKDTINNGGNEKIFNRNQLIINMLNEKRPPKEPFKNI